MEEPQEQQLPLYYILSRELHEEHAEQVMRMLGMHPVICVIVSSLIDARLGFRVSGNVMRRRDDAEAIRTAQEVAEQTGKPALVIGTADFLDAVYADGRREALAKNA